jgi:hypothetical protein
VLRTKTIPTIKVLWCNHGVEEASWEIQRVTGYEKRYPYLFEDPMFMINCFWIILDNTVID